MWCLLHSIRVWCGTRDFRGLTSSHLPHYIYIFITVQRSHKPLTTSTCWAVLCAEIRQALTFCLCTHVNPLAVRVELHIHFPFQICSFHPPCIYLSPPLLDRSLMHLQPYATASLTKGIQYSIPHYCKLNVSQKVWWWHTPLVQSDLNPHFHDFH